MSTPDVSVVVVSWQVRAFVQRCLAALPAALAGVSYEVILVDNASQDGTVAMVRERFPDVVVLENEVNVLYTRAANQGMARARARYVLLLNPDVVAHPGSLAYLVQYAEAHPEAGLLGPRILNAEGEDDWRTGRAFPTPWSEFMDWSGAGRWFSFLPFLLKNRRLHYDRRSTSAVPLLSGACLLFSFQLPLNLRKLNPEFVLYGEDIDLCRRVANAGWRRVLVAESVITHTGAASSQQRPALAALMAIIAMNRYFRLWEGKKAAWLHRALLGLVGLFKTGLFCAGGPLRPAWHKKCALYRLVLCWASGCLARFQVS